MCITLLIIQEKEDEKEKEGKEEAEPAIEVEVNPVIEDKVPEKKEGEKASEQKEAAPPAPPPPMDEKPKTGQILKNRPMLTNYLVIAVIAAIRKIRNICTLFSVISCDSFPVTLLHCCIPTLQM